MLYLGFLVREDGSLVAPCGCSRCDDTVQSGHIFCSPSPDELLEDELRENGCYRHFQDGHWSWNISTNLIDLLAK